MQNIRLLTFANGMLRGLMALVAVDLVTGLALYSPWGAVVDAVILFGLYQLDKKFD